MKKSEIFVPLSRNRTRKNDRDGFRDVFRIGSGVLYGGGRPGAGCGQETGICKAAEKRRVPKMAFRAPGGRQQPGTDRLVQNPDIPTRRPGRMGGTLPPPLRRCPGRPAGSRRWRAKSDAGKTAWRADGCAASPGRQGCGAEEPFAEVGTLRVTGSLPEFVRPVCRMKIE